jgi:RHS repeat-associated protein
MKPWRLIFIALLGALLGYTYADGLGRTIESRAESETNGQYRVANSVCDLRGNPKFQTVSYFSSGVSYTAPSGTHLGALTGYDGIGRANQSTPAVSGTFTAGQLTGTTATGGDTGSPVAPATTAFVDGNNPWATVVTDAQGKTKKSYRDAYGRTITVTDVTSNGNYNTSYAYDLVGDLTNVTDNANNRITLFYDSLGRKTSLLDPDMGTWSYVYDNAGRLTQQTDACTNTLKFYYSDALGRLTSKQIYNLLNSLVGTVTYAYDTSGDPNYTVYPGQLYKVTDLQGYERSSYDVRGRVLKNGRFLNLNSIEYVTQATYDDADRVAQLTYPNNAATLQYTYDTAGHLSQVRSLAGTGTQEIFYTPQGFNALDQMTGYTGGNGVATAYAYYANSARLQNLTTAFRGTNYQNLSYNYDHVSDVTAISDGVYSGSASAAQTGLTYDDFYRVTAINSTARGIKTYGYNSIGNLLTNQDFGSGLYQYGAKPHAVTSANGVSYGYDACGNMTTRGGQTLEYDAQNQLVQVAGANDNVLFGYDDGGERLWRAGTNGYTIWIGGIYEVNNGTVLCHVVAGRQLVASFQPLCGGPWSKAFGEERWYAVSSTFQSAMAWPFQHGRSPITYFAGYWVAILGVCVAGGRGIRLKRHEWRRSLRFGSLWKQVVTVLAISAFLTSGTSDVEAATYSPAFYYYHTDHLGSSNVLTDRSGNVVQHYEYSTFGQQSYVNNTSAFPVSNRYTGQIADDETGLYYYGGRYYDPQLGRFIQPDPTVPEFTDSQSLNRYSYCRNNPLNATDPSGFDDSGGGGWGDPGGAGGSFWGNDGYSSFSYAYGSGNGGWWSSWSATYGGVNFSTYSATMMGSYSYSESSISWDGNTAELASGTYNEYVPGYTYDGVQMPGQFVSSGFSYGNFVQSAAASSPVAAESGGGGLLAQATNAAELISMLPIPGVGDVAGLLGAAGKALQGKYGEAVIDIGVTAAATFGLGAVVGIAAKRMVNAHHALPKFLGGDVNQVLSKLDSNIHTEFHQLLGQDLKNAGIPLNVGGRGGSAADWARYMRVNSGAQRTAIDSVLNTSRAIDTKYGTQITQDVWKNIVDGNFTPYP